MVPIKVKFFLALLVGTALATPLATPVEARDRRLTCTVAGKKVSFSEDYAKSLAKKAPSGKNIHTASGYPHEFQNLDHIKWDNKACMSKNVKTLEFPILEGKNPKMYPWNKRPREEPGPCRVVYSETDGHYCGVMCHKDRKPNGDDQKGFNRCV
ncbi:hypothetical protein VTN00DRAFT_3399 [Thermoascus crustaceus]|uniref:uncharacterized protein n=1 Tax=Thermoascus crustaceus TaxID=5088 RepID=UPI003743B28E